MLNYLWGIMILLGVFWGILTGRPAELTGGIMEVAKEAGIIKGLTRLMRPFVRFMFPGIPKGHKAEDEISTNIAANVLGLGWAATPAGLKAMESLAELEEERRSADSAGHHKISHDGVRSVPKGTASNEMCTFLIMNISSLQLVPVSIIAYRSQYGSANPTAVVGPAIAATAVSTLAAVAFCKVMSKKRRA